MTWKCFFGFEGDMVRGWESLHCNCFTGAFALW